MTRHLHDDAAARAEARVARAMGLSMSQWDDLDEHDRAYALALDLVDAEDAAGRCTCCGGVAAECQNPDNQHAYVVTFRRCFRTLAVMEAEEKRRGKDGLGDMKGVLTVVRLDPALKKSATRPQSAK
ncbi:hypothetical protein [Phycicoccus jejuensis]|uniref:hypothetical protein n=1 Tax=Phycicoccus jejuensis TaxID=367299 RepID=UPI0004C37FF4|nr:hypothetical protein [Phycicoccus jejuensis]